MCDLGSALSILYTGYGGNCWYCCGLLLHFMHPRFIIVSLFNCCYCILLSSLCVTRKCFVKVVGVVVDVDDPDADADVDIDSAAYADTETMPVVIVVGVLLVLLVLLVVVDVLVVILLAIITLFLFKIL